MKVISWNLNSVKARGERLAALVERHAPDVVCLQETKVVDAAFPTEQFAQLGYHATVHGQKAYNGVAILTRAGVTDVTRGMSDGVDDLQARLVAVTVDGVRVVNVYVPNGSRVGTEKYVYKLAWLRRLRAYLDGHADASAPLLVCGDFNCAPRDSDVRHPEQWAETVLCHADVRQHLRLVRDFGLADVMADNHPEGGIYTWWDYRMLGFPKNDGLRIDLILASGAAASRCRSTEVDRDERKGKLPSDHAPVIATF